MTQPTEIQGRQTNLYRMKENTWFYLDSIFNIAEKKWRNFLRVSHVECSCSSHKTKTQCLLLQFRMKIYVFERVSAVLFVSFLFGYHFSNSIFTLLLNYSHNKFYLWSRKMAVLHVHILNR